MKPKKPIRTDELKPQQSLETILQIEIEVAEKITAAKDKSDEKISAAQEETAGLKTRIIEDARSERDRLISEGISKSHALADESIKKAADEARQFMQSGKQFEDEAADYVLRLVMGLPDQREEK